MDTFDFKKSLKDLYAATQKVKEVMADSGTFLAVDGQGAPGGPAFQDAMAGIYSTVYTLKFTLKGEGKLDFKVCNVECVWLCEPCETPRAEWQWRLLVRIPGEVAAKDITAVKKAITEKKGLDLSGVKRIRWKEGRAVQVMHVGPYDEVGRSYAELDEYAREQGYKARGPGHEIYISDPRRTAPEKLKTIVRLGVAKR